MKCNQISMKPAISIKVQTYFPDSPDVASWAVSFGRVCNDGEIYRVVGCSNRSDGETKVSFYKNSNHFQKKAQTSREMRWKMPTLSTRICVLFTFIKVIC